MMGRRVLGAIVPSSCGRRPETGSPESFASTGTFVGVPTLKNMRSSRSKLLVVVTALVVWTVVARKRGYKLGGDVVVRCGQGHLFTTIWVPGASIKAVKLGWVRIQYCPVGRHWALVKPVRDEDLTDEELRAAHEHHDIRVP
jgi:hypothetical protein